MCGPRCYSARLSPSTRERFPQGKGGLRRPASGPAGGGEPPIAADADRGRAPREVAMGANGSDGLRGLTPRSDDAWDRFEAAWDRGERPRTEDYLVGFEPGERRALLAALLGAEIEHRRRRGQHPDPGQCRP